MTDETLQHSIPTLTHSKYEKILDNQPYEINQDDNNTNAIYYSEEEEESSNDEENNTLPSCDVCDRDFPSLDLFNKHMSEHRVCGLDGCTFQAHEKLIDKHIRMQHSTGLYDKIRNVNTPENIAKWLEERKKRFPTKENIVKRQEAQKEKFKRGERIRESSNRNWREKERWSLVVPAKTPTRKKKSRTQLNNKKSQSTSIINERCDWNGKMLPFKGTKNLYAESFDNETNDYSDDDDDEGEIEETNALSSLLMLYKSDDDEEDLSSKENLTSTETATNLENHQKFVISENEKSSITTSSVEDDEAPLEQRIERQPINEFESKVDKKTTEKSPNSSRKRKRVHQKDDKHSKCLKQNKDEGGGGEEEHADYKSSQPFYRKRKVTLLEKLLNKEITQERNMILQCVNYVVSNNFFKDN